MASTYSTNLKIELQATGENPGTWGTITNTNLGTALEQAIVGYGNPSYASDANLTLTYTNTNAAQTARSLVLNVTSAVSLTATRELVVPTIQKQYIVQNNTTGAQSITVKTSAGTGITVPNGRKAHLYVDGTNVIQMFDFVDINGGTIDGTTIGGASAVAGTFTTLTATTLGGALNANSQAITNANIDSGTIDGATIGGSSAGAGTFTTLTTSSTVTLNGGTANGLVYLDGSKVATSGSAVTFDGTNLATTGTASATKLIPTGGTATGNGLYLPAANTLALSTNGTERVRVDSSGNLGLGVTPSGNYTLQTQINFVSGFKGAILGGAVIGASGSGYPGVGYGARFTNTGDSYLYGATDTANLLTFKNGGFQFLSAPSGTAGNAITFTQAMTLDSSGNLGLGVTPPASTLPGIFFGAVGNIVSGNNSALMLGNAYIDGAVTRYRTSKFAAQYEQDNLNGQHLWYTAPSGTAGNAITFTQAMTLNASGNLGIGTASPTAILHTKSSAGAIYIETTQARGSNNNFISFRDPAGEAGYVGYGASNSNFYIWNSLTGNTLFGTSNTERARIDSSGNLGIGTASPAYSLDVNGAINASADIISQGNNARISLYRSAGINYFDWASGQSLYFSTQTSAGGGGRSTKMTLDAAGNLGLGVTPSAWLGGGYIDFQGNGYVGNAAAYSSNTLSTGLNAYYATGDWRYKASSLAATRFDHTNGTFAWYTAPSGTAGNAITFTQAMTLDASGNLGVGTTSPDARLTLNGSSNSRINMRAAGVRYGTVYADSGLLAVSSITSIPLVFGTNDTERMRLDSSGNLGLGTTTFAYSAGNRVAFEVNGSTDSVIAVKAGNTASAYLQGASTQATLSSVGAIPLIFGTNSSERARIDSSGNLGLGVTPSAWSGIKSIQAGTAASFSGGSGFNDAFVASNAYYDGTNWRYINTNPAYYNSVGGAAAARWYTAASGTAGNAITFTQAMTLDASGNIAIASNKLFAQGNGYNGDTSAASSGTLCLWDASGFTALKNNWGSGAITFTVGASERARITSGGDLLVGTTAAIAGSNARLQVDSGSTFGTIVKSGGGAANANTTLWHVATSGNNLFIEFGTESSFTGRGSIDYNRAGGLTRYNTTSDYRAKDIIGPVQDPGATIDALKVYEGVMKGATQSRPMLIAHEAQEHAPYAVSGIKDEVNEDGTPKFQQMDVSSLVPLLLAELQSLRARVATLENN